MDELLIVPPNDTTVNEPKKGGWFRDLFDIFSVPNSGGEILEVSPTRSENTPYYIGFGAVILILILLLILNR